MLLQNQTVSDIRLSRPSLGSYWNGSRRLAAMLNGVYLGAVQAPKAPRYAAHSFSAA